MKGSGMSDRISRRNFLKLSGLGAAATATLTGCGPMARYVVREPYNQMPEFSQPGRNVYYATTCAECPAGCGLIMRTYQGRAIKAEGNPNHPVNRGKICPRGLTAVQGLYNPDRITGPRRQQRGGQGLEELDWEAATGIVADALQNTPAGEVAFFLGLASDHLFDFVSELTGAAGAPDPVRYGAMAMFDARASLLDAVEQVYGVRRYPYFDLAQADVTLVFGANLFENWLSPVTYGKAYGHMRQGNFGRRGYMISFEPRQSLASANADEWFAIAPGTEGMVAQAIGALVAAQRGDSAPGAFDGVDLEAVVEASGISADRLRHVAELFASASQPLAIPGGNTLAHADGLSSAQAVLALNLLAGNTGQPGGVSFSPTFEDQAPGISNLEEVQQLVQRMNAGEVSVLFVHGVNPVFELPAGLGFEQALAQVPLVISFSSFPDETSLQADYVFPDHTGLEGWGYQRSLPGTDRMAVSAIQPVVAPMYDTRSTVDVLLAAASAGGLALGYSDEVEFIQSRISGLLSQAGGNFTAENAATLWARFLQYGGWWNNEPVLAADAASGILDQSIQFEQALPQADQNRFHLVAYTNWMGDGSVANRPWMQETPDTMTTVMWNSWIEIHPETAARLGIHNNDVVRVTSEAGQVDAVAYLFPGIRPDTVGIPFGQGHNALGRYAEGRGVNPASLLPVSTNSAGDLALGDVLVTIEPTGQRRPISRFESILGVYGEGE
jgi:anaerobic selenocysteine-containing dehydrogenase